MFSRFFTRKDQKCADNETFRSHSRIIGYGAGLMMRDETFPAGTVIPEHAHYHEQISYVASGRCVVTLADGSKKELCAGECAYFGPDEAHQITVLEDDTRITDVFTPIRVDHLENAQYFED